MNTQFEQDFKAYAQSKNALYIDDLSQMRGFNIAIDAELLLSLVTQSNALQTLQDGHCNLDIFVQRKVQEVLTMFWSRYQIQVVVVLEGLRPACLATDDQDHEARSLKKSQKVWQTLKDCQTSSKDNHQTNQAVYKAILKEYGGRFYSQEVINATKKAPNCSFFVAPYTATAQLAQFYTDSLIQVAFGTSRLLCHSDFEQAIVDVNIEAGTFTFIDRADLGLGLDNTMSNICRFQILSGAVYNNQELRGERTQEDLFKQLEQVCDKTTKPEIKKTCLKPPSSDMQSQLINLKLIIQEKPIALNKDRQLVSTKTKQVCVPDRNIFGIQFSPFVFYCMSQGLLDPKTLEMVQNRTTLDEVVLAPSYILKEAWTLDQRDVSRSIGHFFGLSLANLLENDNSSELKNRLADDANFSAWLHENHMELNAGKKQCRSDWNLTDSNIANELDRSDQSDVSFYFVLRWLQYEIRNMKSQRSGADSLLSTIASTEKVAKQPKLTNQRQLLAMCYLQYLESNQFIGFQEDKGKTYQSYLYGHLLENSSPDFDEAILILLEMLRVFFPAGQRITEALSHEEASTDHSKSISQAADKEPVTLLSRIFSLLKVDLGDHQSQTLLLKKEQLDFDLALFNTYASTFKKQMRFVFQSIMYRSLRENRYDINVDKFQDAIQALSFKKTDAFPIGLFMKSLLTGTSLQQAGRDFDLTGDQIDSCLNQCLALWKKVSFITTMLKQNDSINENLAAQFSTANTFLVNKLRSLGKAEMADDLSN